MTGELTVAELRYLKAAWYVQRDEAVVTVGAIAERLGVSHPSASSTVGRLVAHGALARVDGREFGLTERGRERALRLVRRHRLLETFLADVLGLPWDEVHDETELLEWWVSERLEDRIAAVLGHPSRDPHGDPIPAVDGRHDEVVDLPLSDLDPGEVARVVRVADKDPELLRYLADQGLGLGSVLRVDGREPFGGPLLLSSNAGAHSLGELAVQAISVTRIREGGDALYGGASEGAR